MRRGAAVILVLAFGARGDSLSNDTLFDPSPLTGSGDAPQFNPTIAAHDAGYLVAFADYRRSRNYSDVRAAWFDPGGQQLSEGPVATEVLGQEEPSVACDFGQCLIAWVTDRPGLGADVMAVRYSVNGARLDVAPILVAGPPTTYRDNVSVAAGAGVYLVVWNDDGDILGQVVRASTGAPMGVPLVVSALPEWEFEPRVAFDGTDWHVVWTRIATTSNVVHHQLIRADGAMVARDDLGLGDSVDLAAGPANSVAMTWLVPDGGGYEIGAVRFIAGAQSDPIPLHVGWLDANLGVRHGMAFTGQGYKTFWQTSNVDMQTSDFDLDGGFAGSKQYTLNEYCPRVRLACHGAGCLAAVEYGYGMGTIPLPPDGGAPMRPRPTRSRP